MESLKLWTLENELTNKETILEVINTIKYSLVESVYIRQSLFIRYILKYIFKVRFSLNILYQKMKIFLFLFIIESSY